MPVIAELLAGVVALISFVALLVVVVTVNALARAAVPRSVGSSPASSVESLDSPEFDDAVAALIVLGYGKRESERMAREHATAGLGVEQIVGRAIKSQGG